MTAPLTQDSDGYVKYEVFCRKMNAFLFVFVMDNKSDSFFLKRFNTKKKDSDDNDGNNHNNHKEKNQFWNDFFITCENVMFIIESDCDRNGSGKITKLYQAIFIEEVGEDESFSSSVLSNDGELKNKLKTRMKMVGKKTVKVFNNTSSKQYNNNLDQNRRKQKLMLDDESDIVSDTEISKATRNRKINEDSSCQAIGKTTHSEKSSTKTDRSNANMEEHTSVTTIKRRFKDDILKLKKLVIGQIINSQSKAISVDMEIRDEKHREINKIYKAVEENHKILNITSNKIRNQPTFENKIKLAVPKEKFDKHQMYIYNLFLKCPAIYKSMSSSFNYRHQSEFNLDEETEIEMLKSRK